MFYSDAATTTRELTPEGMLRASAIITRSGLFPYEAQSLGMKGESTVMVERPASVLRDPATLDSVRGAAVTLGHPPEDVGPQNWRKYVVGNVVGEPRVDRTGNVIADIIIGREDAIAAVQGGEAELSIGYDFSHAPAPDDSAADLLTTGAIHVNHVAIVPRGRAGPGVRILDQEGFDMASIDEAKLRDIVASAVQATSTAKAADSLNPHALAQAIAGPIKAAVDTAIADMKKEMEEADAKKKGMDPGMHKRESEDMPMGKKSPKEAADALIAAATADERKRSQLLHDAGDAGLLRPEQVVALRDSPLKEITIAIVGDTVPNASQQDELYLKGIADAKLAAARVSQQPYTGAPSFPSGVGRLQDGYQMPLAPNGTPFHGAGATTSKAYDQYVESLQKWPDDIGAEKEG